MPNIKIVTDSTLDLPKHILEENDIIVVPLSITIDGESYVDGIDIAPDEFIRKMKQSEELPKSSQPPAGQFLEVFNSLTADGSEVIAIHMTSKMSGTVQSAQTAAQMAEGKVTVIDSKYISHALAFQVLEAAKMAKEGKTSEEIIARVDQIQKATRLFVVVDTLDNLVKGGRIGKGKAMLSSLLNIKPIASLDTGEYTPVAKVRSQSQIVKYLVKQLLQDSEGKEIKGIGITEADAMELSIKLKEAILEVTSLEDVTINATTPVISTHTGVGAIGFMYYAE